MHQRLYIEKRPEYAHSRAVIAGSIIRPTDISVPSA